MRGSRRVNLAAEWRALLAGGEVREHADAALPGLTLRVRGVDKGAWRYTAKGRPRKPVTIGPAGSISLAQRALYDDNELSISRVLRAPAFDYEVAASVVKAFQDAAIAGQEPHNLLRQVRGAGSLIEALTAFKTKDPATRKRQDALSRIGRALQIETRRRRYKAASPVIVGAWASRPVSSISSKEVASILEKAENETPKAAQRLRRELSIFFDWCVQKGICFGNPVPRRPVETAYGLGRERGPVPESRDKQVDVSTAKEMVARYIAGDTFNLATLRKQAIAVGSWGQVGVYFFFDGDELVYVGQSVNGSVRLMAHWKAGDKKFDRFHFVPCELDKLTAIENAHICNFVPRYNTCPIARAARRLIKSEMARALECAT